jgi:hypothetical protein
MQIYMYIYSFVNVWGIDPKIICCLNSHPVFLNIWVLSLQQVNVWSCSSKSYNILCNSLEAWEIGIKKSLNFLHVHLCWCICTLWNSLFKMVWYVVKYLSTKILMSKFEKIPNCETFFYHDSSWLWANLSNWNSVMKT